MIKIYTYGLPFGPDKDDAAAVQEQMWLAHRYYNDLVQLENARRDAYAERLRELVPEVARAEEEVDRLKAEVDEISTRIKAANVVRRKRDVEAEDKAALKAARAALREARAAAKAARSQGLTDEVRRTLAEQDLIANEIGKSLRAHCGVYWGTYLLIEDQIKAAKKSKGRLNFHRWTGEGRVGVHVSGGMPTEDVFAAGTLLRLEIEDDGRKKPRGRVMLRIGSDVRAPVWSHWSMVMHRPMPEGRIKKAWCQRKRVGARWRWELQIVVDEGTLPARIHPSDEVAAIDIGWRKRAQGYRYAVVVDEDWDTEELVLDQSIIDRMLKSEAIRSDRDKAMNVARDRVAAWMSKHRAELSPELARRTKAIHQWRSARRLRSLVWHWGQHRVAGDEHIYPDAESWRLHDAHLDEWEANGRAKACGHRREVYRLQAKALCERYSTLVIEDFSLHEIAAVPAVDEASDLLPEAQHQRFLASLHTFREALQMMAAKTGTQIVKRPARLTTMRCHACDGLVEVGAPLYVTCPHCSKAWDQDVNAARNLLLDHEREDLSDAAE